MLPNLLNDNQIKLVTKFCTVTVQNNKEVNIHDVPYLVDLIIKLAQKGYWINENQMDKICDNLHSLSDRTAPTHDILRDFLKGLANVGYYCAMHHHSDQPEHYVRITSKIVDDIIEEKDVEYSVP